MKTFTQKITKSFLLKDILINKKEILFLSNLIKKNLKEFDNKNFEKEILKEFGKLELKERIFWICKNLKKFIFLDYKNTIKLFLKLIPKKLEKDRFIFASLTCYISTYGCDKKNLKISLNILKNLTKIFSPEFDIRFFINKFPNETFEEMVKWSKNKNYKIRRISCEGLRPKLPWAIKINFDYKKAEEILDNIYYDNLRINVRSCANHLNDISKFDEIFVLKLLKKWKKENKQNKKEMNYLINHSLRSSIKKGNKKTLEFLGFNLNPKINFKDFKFEKNKIKIGEKINFFFKIISKKNEKLLIDYIINYPNNSSKVFKIKILNIKKNEKIEINKKHRFIKMTTKKLYFGKYNLNIQINGKKFGKINFYLNEK